LTQATTATKQGSDDPVVGLLDLVAERAGASRWIVAKRDGDHWEAFRKESSARDELLVGIAPTVALPTMQVMSAMDLGDAGERIAATGVESLLVVAGGPETDPCVVFLENPDPSAVEAAVDGDLAHRLAPLVRGALDLRRRATGLQILGRWLPAVDELSRGELDDATGLELLGDVAGASALMSVRRLRSGQGISVAERSGKRWRQRVEEISADSSPDDPTATLEAAGLAVGIVITDEWSRGRSPDGTLLIAAEGDALSNEVLDTCATILGLASARSLDASATRSNAMLQERARIASVIHEGITQVLTNVAIQMEILDQLMADTEAARTMLKSLRQAVLEALDSLRGAILELNPTSPEWTDLSGGLERFVADFASQWGMEVTFSLEGTSRDVDPEVIAVVFGFVQEALTNVRKHAATAPTEVLVTFLESKVEVEVADQGPGFDPDGGEDSGFRLHQGLGLTRSRVTLAGGRFTLVSAPGEGTTLKLEIAG
jgi:signal transduction histidine kinase